MFRSNSATFGQSYTAKHQSGIPYAPTNNSPTFLLLFGTLLLVVTFFIVIHVYYNIQPKWMKISYIASGRKFFSSPFMFARFDNSPDDDATSCINVEFEKSAYDDIVDDEKENEINDIEVVRPDELNVMNLLSDCVASTSVNNLVEVELE